MISLRYGKDMKTLNETLNVHSLCEYACMCVCVNVDEDAGRGCMQECEGGNRVRPCIMNQRSNCVWRGWACLWDVPS